MNEFIELVQKMRAAQKAYFRFLDVKDLIEAKRLESHVDRALAALSPPEPPEPPPLPEAQERLFEP